MNEYNDPFYFALPIGASGGDLSRAQEHIAKTFGVRGKCEVVSRQWAYMLCRLTGLAGAA